MRPRDATCLYFAERTRGLSCVLRMNVYDPDRVFATDLYEIWRRVAHPNYTAQVSKLS